MNIPPPPLKALATVLIMISYVIVSLMIRFVGSDTCPAVEIIS